MITKTQNNQSIINDQYQEILDYLHRFKNKHGLYIIKPRELEILVTICEKLNYEYKSNIAYIGKGARTRTSHLSKRAGQEMGWSNFEGATFVKKIGRYLDCDLKNKKDKEQQERTRRFICTNFKIECIEFPLETDLLKKETEFISEYRPCLNDKKNN